MNGELEDPTGIDAWEAMKLAMPPLTEEEQAQCDAFIAQVRRPVAPGDARRHHFIAQFFQRRFANADERLTVVPLDDPENPRTPHISDIAVRRDLYTHIDEDIGETIAVERILAVIEENAARALQTFDSGVRPFPASNEDRGHLAAWIAFQLVRDPYTRREMEALADQSIKMQLSLWKTPEAARSHLEETLGREPLGEEVSEFVDAIAEIGEDGVEFIPHQNDFIGIMLDCGQAMFPHIFRRSFSVMHFGEPGLVLCDQPVVLYRRSPNRNPPFTGVGVVNADEVWLPLDRHNVLVLHDREVPLSGVVNAPSMLRDSFNQAIIANAKSEIYCHPDDLHVVRAAQLPEPNRPIFGMDGGSWLIGQTDGVNNPPKRRKPHRYRRAGKGAA